MKSLRFLLWLASAASSFSVAVAQQSALPLRTNDVIAFLGGAAVVAAQQAGHGETLLALTRPELHLRGRSFAWEGDTVFDQPRELNYPKLTNQLAQAGATVVLFQFGQMESLAGEARLTNFVAAYEQLLDRALTVVPRLVLVTPPPVESQRLNDSANTPLRYPWLPQYVAAIREMGSRRGLPVVDLFTPLAGRREPGDSGRLTQDGVQLSSRGHFEVARQLVVGLTGKAAGISDLAVDGEGRFQRPELEVLREAVVAKNRLWFDYSRPMNWAFLGGDRTEQLSSRDHRNRNVRWFPAEMELFVPLIAAEERQIQELAEAARRGVQ